MTLVIPAAVTVRPPEPMRNPLPTLRLGSLKFRLMLASVALILVSVALTVHFTLREVRRGTERIVLESREDDARRLAAIVSRRLIGLQRALRAAATTMPRAALDEAPLAIEYLEATAVLRTMFSRSSWSRSMAASSRSRTATARAAPR